jgi:FkbM family methyltransferase
VSEQDFEALKLQIANLGLQLEQSLARERMFREDFSHQLMREVEARISRLMRHTLALPVAAGVPVFTHTLDGHRILLDPNEPFITYHVLEHGEWERPLRTLLSRILAPGDVYVDVGANIGLHVLLAAMLVGESGKILALEPHPKTADLLRRNLEINGLLERVICVQAAACAEHGGQRVFEYFPQHSAMSGFSLDKERVKLFKGNAERVDVDTVTLDGLFSENNVVPDLIKIDVEGFELDVLNGSLNALELGNTAFIMEFCISTQESVAGPGTSHKIFTLMIENGFIALGLHEAGLTSVETPEQAGIFGDVLFVKKASAKYQRILSMIS